MKEIWKPISGFEGLYEVSNMGNVRSVDRIVKRGNCFEKENLTLCLLLLLMVLMDILM